MALWKKYLKPSTVEDALGALCAEPARSAVIAGGTDLLLDLQQGRRSPVNTLVDLNQIPEMTAIQEQDDFIHIGAAASLHKILMDASIQFHAQGVAEACELIGGPQVRNVATLGGNVGHALPAGDGTIALISLNAEAQLASSEGRKWVPVEMLFEGPGRPSFDRSREIIVSFRFPLRGEGEGSAFMRVMRPQGIAIAILNMGIWLRRGKGGLIEDIHIAVGPAGPRPLRAQKMEAVLRGKSFEYATTQNAIHPILQEVKLRTSPHRSTKAYRELILPTLFKRTITEAWERADRQLQ
ncbi:MAG TPA: FAD binding domain-containing protein [Anaerolineales bacterium]|nr:FAD binding domain-containing protein [Anaerolineales bacterium]